MTTPLKLFFSYSHEDESFKNKLNKHLKMLQHLNIISAWQDRDISAGSEWEAEILGNLEQADIILLLVSDNFLASDYCWGKEMERALQRHEEGTARVIPIILKPVDGWYQAPFGKLQALPKDAKPISTWSNEDEAYANIAAGIRKVAENMSKNSKITSNKSAQKTETESGSSKSRRLQRRIDELESQLDLISKRLSLLKSSETTETRVEEKLRLQTLIAEDEKKRQEIETELDNLEEQLS
ncbi:MAG: hypothetical protein RIT27_10 [Pseudomonadota bacterium]|jgi:hypothetical protein